MNNIIKGNLPDKCPHCNTKDRWDWGDMDYAGNSSWQVVTCLNCDTIFHEIYEIVGWQIWKLKHEN
jgi:hypothetical protein